MIEILQADQALFIGIVALVSLMVGSFLNVVAYRLPIMLERAWTVEAQECLGLPSSEPVDRLTLSSPSSACPNCGHKIRPWENLPVVSYIALRGKCSGCGTKISITYPAVELATALLSASLAWHYGVTPAACAAIVLLWMLIALCLIDLKVMLLPDAITLPALWIGLAANYFGVLASLHDAVAGAVVGYMTFWTIGKLFYIVRGVEGLGQGDYKLFALFGAWGGWQVLPATLLIASLTTAAVGMAIRLVRKDRYLPFGPGLILGGVISLVFGSEINHWLLYR
ncbi:A24 family peptidase [Pseudomonas aeruginosa]